jgi:hypothetical protein
MLSTSRQDTFSTRKKANREVSDKLYTYIVKRPGKDVAATEISWCVPLRSVPLEG